MTLTAQVVDGLTGEPVEARVQVLDSGGRFVHPQESLLKRGPGLPFFYCPGEFGVEVPRGRTAVLAERGTEYKPAQITVEASHSGAMAIDIPLERWTDLGARGWHPGNTHIHYDEHEARPDERLRMDPRVEDLRVTAISVLRRWDLDYASNKYPVGLLNDFTSAHHYVECGEECRHNDRDNSMDRGYGHVMFLRINEMVEPISRGFLVDDVDPDYPPLCYACDDARRQGGLAIWCHNGRGSEAPVAAALGKLDALNLFDPYWMDPEYDLWYDLLNCGIALPASTGSDWFICSANRVYVQTGQEFRPEDWFAGLKSGRTFITNGPAVMLRVDGAAPGEEVEVSPGHTLEVTVMWESFYAIQEIDIVRNGEVVHRAEPRDPEQARRGSITAAVGIPEDGWIAARLGSDRRDSFFQPIYAHSSAVYVRCGVPNGRAGEAATRFVRRLDEALEWVAHVGRYRSEAQRAEVADLFGEGKAIYERIAQTGAHAAPSMER